MAYILSCQPNAMILYSVSSWNYVTLPDLLSYTPSWLLQWVGSLSKNYWNRCPEWIGIRSCTAAQMEEVRVKKPLNENESIIVCCEKSCFILIFLIGSLFGKGLSV